MQNQKEKSFPHPSQMLEVLQHYLRVMREKTLPQKQYKSIKIILMWE